MTQPRLSRTALLLAVLHLTRPASHGHIQWPKIENTVFDIYLSSLSFIQSIQGNFGRQQSKAAANDICKKPYDQKLTRKATYPSLPASQTTTLTLPTQGNAYKDI